MSRGWVQAVEFVRREGWDEGAWPFNLPVLRGLDVLTLHPRCTFIVGENGSGKSTLIEAMAEALGFGAEGGSREHRANNAYRETLSRFVRPHRNGLRPPEGWFLRAESHFGLAGWLDDVGDRGRHGGRALLEQSHGESVFALLQHRFTGEGLYIMDEPEAGLSPSRQLSFLARMHELIEDASQFIIATHSPIILGYPGATIYQASSVGLDKVAYEDTDIFQVSRGFLNHRETMLRQLMAP